MAAAAAREESVPTRLSPWLGTGASEVGESARLLISEEVGDVGAGVQRTQSWVRSHQRKLLGSVVLISTLVCGARHFTRSQLQRAPTSSSAEAVHGGTVDLLGMALPTIRWETDEQKCLMVSGGKNIPGRGIVLWDCSSHSESTRFSFPPSGEGLIRWAKHPERCVDVAGGKTQNGNGLQLWDCSTQLQSMQWLLPKGEMKGQIRMKFHPDKCINLDDNATNANGARLVIWDCQEQKEEDTKEDETHLKPHPEMLWHLQNQMDSETEDDKVMIAQPKKVTCHTAVEGEKCWTEVNWAMTVGITNHPDWYPDLTNISSEELFQAAVYKHNATRCPLPCNPHVEKSKAKKEAEKKEKEKEKAAEEKQDQEAQKAKEVKDKAEKSQKHLRKVEPEEEECRTVEEGEECHVNVLWAMQTGIFLHPEWYLNLTKDSTFEEFQQILHSTVTKAKCPKPCKCHTAMAGEDCHDSVVWIFERGLTLHPNWYKGLSKNSSYYAVQKRLHQDENPICERPCHPRLFRGDPSLFCFSVFRAEGYEPALMRAQLSHRAGIFACDEFAIVANEHITLGDGPYGPVKSLKMPPASVGISKDGTAANTLVFMQAWAMIKYDFRYKNHDWTIKADPDAVVLPDRMRNHLGALNEKKLYVKNCNKYPGAIGWPMMFGALEAFSRDALEEYMENAQKCKDDLQWQAWGEDLFMGECLNHLGVGSAFDATMVSDNVCTGVNCADGQAGAYHPFKDEQKWMECYHTALGTVQSK